MLLPLFVEHTRTLTVSSKAFTVALNFFKALTFFCQVPADWPSSDNFNEMSVLPRALWFFAWYKIVLAKYIAAFLLAEGACVMSGLAYNGVDEATGRVKWNGCANVKLRRYEFSLILKHY